MSVVRWLNFRLQFIALSIPTFGPILDFLGASAILFTVLLFPPLFFLYLQASGELHDERSTKDERAPTDDADGSGEYPQATWRDVLRTTPRWQLALCGTIIGEIRAAASKPLTRVVCSLRPDYFRHRVYFGAQPALRHEIRAALLCKLDYGRLEHQTARAADVLLRPQQVDCSRMGSVRKFGIMRVLSLMFESKFSAHFELFASFSFCFWRINQNRNALVYFLCLAFKN